VSATVSSRAREGAQGGAWYEACRLADIPADVPHHVDIAGFPVAITWAEGDLYAIHDVCSHADIPLSEGEVEGVTVECWLHGSRFDLRTGEPTGLPATRPVPVYQTAIEGEGDDAVVLVNLASSGATTA
jgi:3-phenylpropionate/trans-cinnamate dioxygenase ferredoxin subunit